MKLSEGKPIQTFASLAVDSSTISPLLPADGRDLSEQVSIPVTISQGEKMCCNSSCGLQVTLQYLLPSPGLHYPLDVG